MAPAGIEPATFRFVAQHLNHCATAVPTLNAQQLVKPTQPNEQTIDIVIPRALVHTTGPTGDTSLPFNTAV